VSEEQTLRKSCAAWLREHFPIGRRYAPGEIEPLDEDAVKRFEERFKDVPKGELTEEHRKHFEDFDRRCAEEGVTLATTEEMRTRRAQIDSLEMLIKRDRDRITDVCRAMYEKPDGKDFPIALIAMIVHDGGPICGGCYRSSHDGECSR
jgi:hypothetical protein